MGPTIYQGVIKARTAPAITPTSNISSATSAVPQTTIQSNVPPTIVPSVTSTAISNITRPQAPTQLQQQQQKYVIVTQRAQTPQLQKIQQPKIVQLQNTAISQSPIAVVPKPVFIGQSIQTTTIDAPPPPELDDLSHLA